MHSSETLTETGVCHENDFGNVSRDNWRNIGIRANAPDVGRAIPNCHFALQTLFRVRVQP